MSLIEPTLFERHRTAFIVAGLATLLVILLLIFWAFSGGGKKEGKLISNVGVATGENAIVGNLVVNQGQVVNNAANNTNKAVGDLRNSVNKPSNQFNGAGAGDRFCRDFPGDPSCQ
jgi:hypothetical protein